MGLVYIVLALAVCLFASPCLASAQYEPDDWISYTDLRYITSITMDEQYVYFGTTGGVSRYDRYRERWDYPLTTSNGLPDNRVKQVAYDPATGYLWVDTFSGVCHYRPTLGECIIGGQFPDPVAKKPKEDYRFPDLFTEFGYTFYPEGYIEDQSFRRYYLSDSVEDGWGNLWVGTWGLNAGRADLTTAHLEMLRVGLIEDDVTAMATDGDEIWFGGTGGPEGSEGITRYNRKSGQWAYFEARLIDGLLSNEVTCIAADSDYVWLGTQHGLSRYDKRENEWKGFTSFDGLSTDGVTDVVVDGDSLWVGTISGLNMVNKRDGFIKTISVEGLEGAAVSDVALGDGYIWVVTNNGVYRCSKGEGLWEEFTGPSGYLDPVVTAIGVDKSRVWFGVLPGWQIGEGFSVQLDQEGMKLRLPYMTLGKPPSMPFLISVYDRLNGEWKRYFPPAGFTAGSLLGLAVGKNAVWMATGSGALRFDKLKGTWRCFSEEDRLIDNRVEAILLEGDYIWFGTEKGVTRFHWNDSFRVY